MEFSLREWRKTYYLVNELGSTLRDARPTYTDDGDYIAPKIEMSREDQATLESKIASLCQRSGKYLDQCGLRMPRPLWVYDRKNPETHASAPEFKYRHLMEAAYD